MNIELPDTVQFYKFKELTNLLFKGKEYLCFNHAVLEIIKDPKTAIHTQLCNDHISCDKCNKGE